MCVFITEPPHDKTNTMVSASSEDSDQHGHAPSLIRDFAVLMKTSSVLSYSLSAQRRLIRLGGCPGWSESSLGTKIILLVLSCCDSYLVWCHCFQRIRFFCFFFQNLLIAVWYPKKISHYFIFSADYIFWSSGTHAFLLVYIQYTVPLKGRSFGGINLFKPSGIFHPY